MTKDINSLVAAVGLWNLNEPNRAIYYKAPQPGYGSFGICVSNINFVEGEARVTVRIPEITPRGDASGRLLIGYRGTNQDYIIAGIGGNQCEHTLYSFSEGVWAPIVLSGSAENLVSGKAYNISVHIQGLRLILKQDDVPVIDHVFRSPLPTGQLGLYTWGNDPVEFTNFCVKQRQGAAFIIMQLEEPYLSLYNQVIQPIARDEFNLETSNAGEMLGRVILQDIVRGLEEARVIIAEVTPANKNVFYEVGYAHALQKPTILLVAREPGKELKLPFDITTHRCIIYENTIAGKSRLETELRRHLGSIIPIRTTTTRAHKDEGD